MKKNTQKQQMISSLDVKRTSLGREELYPSEKLQIRIQFFGLSLNTKLCIEPFREVSSTVFLFIFLCLHGGSREFWSCFFEVRGPWDRCLAVSLHRLWMVTELLSFSTLRQNFLNNFAPLFTLCLTYKARLHITKEEMNTVWTGQHCHAQTHRGLNTPFRTYRILQA